MSATYWVAKYVDDPFKNETKNVGVIVRMNDTYSAKFFGERADGVWDARIIKGMSHPLVYTQWKDFWRRKLTKKDVYAIMESATANYTVVQGGEVTDTGSDNVGEVCDFLYGLIVGSGPKEAFEWYDDDVEIGLVDDILSEFARVEVLAHMNQLFSRYPIVRDRKIAGTSVVHTPTFSQLNGHLSVMEHIDLGTTRVNKTKERAGWMAYMFEDIKNANSTAEAFSLIRPEGSSKADQIEFARSVLSKGSTVINWSDENGRGQFLEERKRIAYVSPPLSPYQY